MTRMRFGTFLAPHHPLGEHPTLQFQRDLDLAAHLDRLGLDEFWCGEHHSSGWEMIASPEMFLAAAGQRTERIMLGTGVISLPYHHPFNVAQRIVQLDHLTRGRAMFGSGPGALTLFRGDLRVATTIRAEGGARALGTRVSDEVRAAVLERGETWRDRAFVVDGWYISAYEPIRDLAGSIVGMLYVGLPEATYAATRNRVVSSFFAIATLGFGLVLAVTYWIMQGLTRPIR